MIGKYSLAYAEVVTDVYRAIADPTRRIVLDELGVRGEQSLFEITATLVTRHGLSLTRQAVSQHLAVLEEAGLVLTERRGRTKLHTFDPTPLAEIARRWPTTTTTQHEPERTDP